MALLVPAPHMCAWEQILTGHRKDTDDLRREYKIYLLRIQQTEHLINMTDYLERNFHLKSRDNWQSKVT